MNNLKINNNYNKKIIKNNQKNFKNINNKQKIYKYKIYN